MMHPDPKRPADLEAIRAQRAQADQDRRIEAKGAEDERRALHDRKAQRRERVVDWHPSPRQE